MPLDELASLHEKKSSAAGLRVAWTYALRRWVFVAGLPRATTTYHLALKVTRPGPRVETAALSDA